MTTDTTTKLDPDLIEGALTCLLWQGNESSDDPDHDCHTVGAPYSGDPADTTVIPADDVLKVVTALVEFMRHAQGLLDSLAREEKSVWDNPAQVGHDWVLTSFGHGAGFWDRHAKGTASGRVGDTLTELTKLYPCPEGVTFKLYVDDDGRQVWFVS